MKFLLLLILLEAPAFGALSTYVGKFYGDAGGLTNLTGVSGGSATNLTPWASDINGAGYSLTNAGKLVGTNFTGNGIGLTNIPGTGIATAVAQATHATNADLATLATSATTATTATSATSATTAGSATTATYVTQSPLTNSVTNLLAIGTAGQYTKVTFDPQGRETSGTTLSASDIPTLTLSKISDAGTAAYSNATAFALAASVVTTNNLTATNDTRALNHTNSLNAFGGSGALLTAIPTTALTGALPAANFPALTGDVTTSAGSLSTTLAAGNAGNLNSGTLLAARLPTLQTAYPAALTNGDTRPWTNIGGGLLVTNAGVQIGGTASPTSGLNVSNSTATTGVRIGTNGNIDASGSITVAGVTGTTLGLSAPDNLVFIMSLLGIGTNTTLVGGTNYGTAGRTNWSWQDSAGFHGTNNSAASQGFVFTKGNQTNDGNVSATAFVGDGSALTALNASSLSSGTVAAGRMPALTGAITTSAGAVATSLGSFSSANLATALTDESGSAGVVPFFTLTSIASGQIVAWSGTQWTNGAAPSGGTVMATTIVQTNFNLNQVMTNGSAAGIVKAKTWQHVAAVASGVAALDLMVDQSGGNTFTKTDPCSVDTTALSIVMDYTNCYCMAFLSPNATYYFTNSSTVVGGNTAGIFAGTGQTITISSGTNGATGATGSAAAIQTNGVQLSSGPTTINFVAGANTTVTGAVSGATATIGISASSSGASGSWAKETLFGGITGGTFASGDNYFSLVGKAGAIGNAQSVYHDISPTGGYLSNLTVGASSATITNAYFIQTNTITATTSPNGVDTLLGVTLKSNGGIVTNNTANSISLPASQSPTSCFVLNMRVNGTGSQSSIGHWWSVEHWYQLP